MTDKIDLQTQKIAKALSTANGHTPDWPWEIEGGGFVPGWVMYVSEATKAIKQARIATEIKLEK